MGVGRQNREKREAQKGTERLSQGKRDEWS